METIKGFKDYTGDEAVKRQIIKDLLIENFELYGFEPAETPLIEYEEFIRGENKEDEAVSDIFKLKDKGSRNLALRYEFTFQLKRISQNKKLPYKRYQIGEVFRDEPISGNRFRQFTQADIDIIGSETKNQAEILALTSKILNELGIKFQINVNSRKLLNEILEKLKIKNKEQVIRIIDKLDKKPESEVKKELKKYKAESVLEIIKNKEKCKKYKSYSEINELINCCNLYKINLNFTPSLARGLSYYTGNIFEIKSSIKETIAGGGSYLISQIPCTGISFGIERLSSLSEIEIKDTGVLIISINQDKKAVQIAEKLRKTEIPADIFFGKPSKALEYANSKKIQKVIIIGNEEIKNKKLKLKNMETGKEVLVSESGLIKKLI
jgi:histidyl-tRNA synthetase